MNIQIPFPFQNNLSAHYSTEQQQMVGQFFPLQINLEPPKGGSCPLAMPLLFKRGGYMLLLSDFVLDITFK